MSGNVMWKSRIVAVSLGCLGSVAVHACHLLSAQVRVPGPQMLEQSFTTGSTSHTPLSWLSWHSWVPSPHVLLHGRRIGSTSHRLDIKLSWHSRVPSPQVLVQAKRTGGTTHPVHELPLQVCTPSPQVLVQARVAPSALHGEMRRAVRPSQAPKTARRDRKTRRGMGVVGNIDARLRWTDECHNRLLVPTMI